jgi:hypothetical protein
MNLAFEMIAGVNVKAGEITQRKDFVFAGLLLS